MQGGAVMWRHRRWTPEEWRAYEWQAERFDEVLHVEVRRLSERWGVPEVHDERGTVRGKIRWK